MPSTELGLSARWQPMASPEERYLARLAAAEASRSDSRDSLYPPGWSPKTQAQAAALKSDADILFFGGAAGSLKTETMLVDAIRERHNPNLRAIIFRQTFPQMTDIVDKTQRLYHAVGGKFSGTPVWTWKFPSGATVRLAYMEADKDVWQYLGPRYSFIGFDESTLHTEYQVRNIIGRLSSTDRTLRLRMRLASNPGNLGAAWHKKMFLQDACPIHDQDRAVEMGKLDWTACWPSDGYPLRDPDGNGFSVAFIPGRLTDHDLLDAKYVYRLRMMSGSLSSAMEQGCWCELEGAYFACWNKPTMVIPYALVNENWWDAHFISIDYGVGKSSASAHLHVRLQNNKIRTISEFVAPNLSVDEFARKVAGKFIEPPCQGQRRRIVEVFADPANFNTIHDARTGVAGHAVADQINRVLEPYSLNCARASNDRIGGWQLMYRMLNSGEWAVADTCPKLIEAIPTRMHDDARPGDVLKVPGDALDDVMDDARYGLYSFITATAKPQEVRVEEALANIPVEDVTSRVIRHQQILADMKKENRPIGLGLRGARIAKRAYR